MHPSLRDAERGGASIQIWCVSWVLFAGLAGLIAWNLDYQFLSGLDFSVIYKFRWALLRALGLTLGITLVSMVIGSIIGLVAAICLQSPIRPLRWVVTVYVEIWRNTPLVVQLFWIHFALPYISNISTTAIQSGVIAMSVQASAYICEIIRAGIAAVPKGQREASHALGLSRLSLWIDVILPQALKVMIPPLANTAIVFFKLSAILSLLSVGDLMTTGTSIVNATFRPVEVLTFVAGIYFLLGVVFSRGTHRLERFLGSERKS
jgi:polar amino acid transport system permease protein